MALFQVLWKLHYTESKSLKKKKKALEFSNVWSSLIPEVHFTSEFSKQTLRCCFIIGLSYPKYGEYQEAGPLSPPSPPCLPQI